MLILYQHWVDGLAVGDDLTFLVLTGSDEACSSVLSANGLVLQELVVNGGEMLLGGLVFELGALLALRALRRAIVVG